MDIEGAYLEADLPEPIYMRLSKDATESLNSLAPATYGRTIVVKLKKALYGLVVSSKLWYDKLKGVLLKLGLTVHHYDSCVFVGVYRNANMSRNVRNFTPVNGLVNTSAIISSVLQYFTFNVPSSTNCLVKNNLTLRCLVRIENGPSVLISSSTALLSS